MIVFKIESFKKCYKWYTADVEEDVESIGRELTNLRVGFLQMLCVQKLYKKCGWRK